MHPVHLFDKIDKVRNQGHIIWSDKSWTREWCIDLFWYPE
jgi:hypothetical protein